jgi:hypothetical protein
MEGSMKTLVTFGLAVMALMAIYGWAVSRAMK